MNEGRTVFSQLMDWLPKYEFDKCVRRYQGNHRVRSLPTYEQFLVMAFAQLSYRESLRDIQTCLQALGSKLYHSGIRHPTARSTLADANEKRDWRIKAFYGSRLCPLKSACASSWRRFGLEAGRSKSRPRIVLETHQLRDRVSFSWLFSDWYG